MVVQERFVRQGKSYQRFSSVPAKPAAPAPTMSSGPKMAAAIRAEILRSVLSSLDAVAHQQRRMGDEERIASCSRRWIRGNFARFVDAPRSRFGADRIEVELRRRPRSTQQTSGPLGVGCSR